MYKPKQPTNLIKTLQKVIKKKLIPTDQPIDKKKKKKKEETNVVV